MLYPIGIQDFENIRRDKFVYVDKTDSGRERSGAKRNGAPPRTSAFQTAGTDSSLCTSTGPSTSSGTTQGRLYTKKASYICRRHF